MKWRISHPLLFASYFVLFLGGENQDHLSLVVDVVPVLLCSAVGAALLLGGGVLLLRDSSKAALAVTLGIIGFFCYGTLYELLLTRGAGDLIRHRYLFPLVLIFLVGVYLLASRTTSKLLAATAVANTFAVVLVLQAVGVIGVFHLRGGASPVQGATVPELTWLEPSQPPHILYLVLDGYAGAGVLDEIYGFSNESFLGHLESKGFFVARDSHSNFAHTFLSLASTLNLDYLQDLVEPKRLQGRDMTAPRLLIRDNAVVSALKTLGYQYVHFSSGWIPTNENRNADIENPCGKGREFLRLLNRSTALRILGVRGLLGRREHLVLCSFEVIPKMLKGSEPVFVFAHVMAPHPPLIFAADGTHLDDFPDGIPAWTPRERYLGQLQFVNTKVRLLLEELPLENENLIVVIQSDHGPHVKLDASERSGREHLEVAARMGILNAVKLPGGDYSKLYPSVSSVNTFAVIFSELFGSRAGLKPDRSFYSSADRPYEFQDVTEKISF